MMSKEFCQTVRKFVSDEEHDEVKYREFADSIIDMDLVLVTGTLLISNQEKTHKDFWIGVWREYCQGGLQ